MEHEDGVSLADLSKRVKISRQLASHHLKNGLRGIVSQQNGESNGKTWILHPVFYNLDVMATFLQPFIVRAGEVYHGPQEDFEKYLALLLALMTSEL
jgi:hypothetical protein